MASWFTRVIDRITPWDRGGEVERRKKREEEQVQRTANQSNTRRAPTVRQPQNVFDQSISDLSTPKINIGLTEVIQSNEPELVPGKGVLRPEVYEQKNAKELRNQAQQIENRIPRPQQSLANKVRDQFDANTEADQYRRAIQIANKKATENKLAGMDNEKAIGRAVDNARILSKAPHRTGADFGRDFVTGLVPATKDVVVDAAKSVGRGVRNMALVPIESARAEVANLTGNREASQAANNRINDLLFSKKKMDQVREYRDIIRSYNGDFGAIEAEHGKEVADLLKKGSNLGVMDLIGALGDSISVLPAGAGINVGRRAIISGLSQGGRQGLSTAARGVLAGADDALLGVRDAVNLFRSPNATRSISDIGDVLNQADIDDITRTEIPVGQDIPVTGTSESVPINVRNVRNDAPLIRELGGDAQTVNAAQTARQAEIDRARRLAFEESRNVRPDMNIEGVTPQQERLFSLEDAAVKTEQDKIVQDYADMLKSMGEGNGVEMVPTNDGGYIRTSNNVRFGDTKGKRMTRDDWRAEAERQLREGKADPEVQKLFNDAKNPEVQSLLSQGERPDAPLGTPIRVQEARSIPVRDETIVPQNLPETPGTVRATTATAPAKTEAQLIAETQPPTTRAKDLPKSEFDEGGLPPTTQADEGSKIPNTTENDLKPVYERVVESLREQRKAYKSEKKLRKTDFNRRKANYDRIYEEARASGKSSQEAEQMARSALGGEYTKGATANFEIDPADRNKLFDKVHNSDDNLNTKKAFEHLFDAKRTEPLRDWERTRIRRFIQKELGAEEAQQLDELIAIAEQSNDRSLLGRAADFMTSSIAAGDVSAAGRQGLSGLINHPRMSKQAWSDSLKALKSEDGLREFATKLSNDPYVAFIQEKGGQHGKYQTLTDVADEARGVSTDNKLTSWYVNPSNRHYNVYLDSLRHQQKKAVIDKFGGIEGFQKAAVAANPENPDKWMQAWFKVIDRQSGRGTLVKGGGMTAGDVQVLFSARNMASKFQRLASPLDISTLRANPQAYLRQLRETGVQLGAAATTLGVLKQSGIVDVENGKIKIGPTRVDITGGFATIFKAANDIRKAIFDADSQGAFDRSGGDVVKDYFQNQLSPLLGTVMKAFDIRNKDGEWKDKYGNPIDAKWALDAAPMPAVAKTFASDMAFGLNPLEAARNSALSAIGFNTNTYLSADDKDNAARAETADTVNAGLQSIRDTGLLNDKMIKSIDDEGVRDILTGKSDKQLSEDELKKVRNKLAEGITSGTGNDSDSAYRQRGEYDKDLAALRLKKEMLEAEPNPKPSDIKGIDVQIKRSELLQQNDIPFELLEKYQKTGVEDWRDLEETNPELFQQLWALDEMMTKEGVGYKSGSFTEQKYYQKTGRGGRGVGGGGGKRSWSAEFGKITGSGSNAPKVKEYQTMEQAVGKIPYIKRTRPNIVHTIREGRL